MRVLFDHNVPAYLLPLFPGASTAYQAGWHELSNGDLLTVANEAGFGLFITLDRGFREQQNVAGSAISIAILEPAGQSRTEITAAAEALAAAIPQIESGTVITFRSN